MDLRPIRVKMKIEKLGTSIKISWAQHPLLNLDYFMLNETAGSFQKLAVKVFNSFDEETRI